MARIAVYVVIAVVCSAIVGCAATSDFADERAKLEQPVRVDPQPRCNFELYYTSEDKDSGIDAKCNIYFGRVLVFADDRFAESESSWSIKYNACTRFQCTFYNYFEGRDWEIQTVLWTKSPDEILPSVNASYVIDDGGVYIIVLGEKFLVAEWKKDFQGTALSA